MSELLARNFLRALLHAGQQILIHPEGHDGVTDALAALERAAEVITTAHGEAVFSIAGDTLFLDDGMLPHATTEFNGIIHQLTGRGIESFTVQQGADREDLADLALLATGARGDLPVGGTVRLNDRGPDASQPAPTPISGLRRSYASSLEALRGVSEHGNLDLGRVMEVVDGFLGVAPGPALMLATVRNYDETTFYHSVNVCLLSLALGRSLGLSEENLRMLGTGALLHDIGRVLLQEVALTKPGRLTNEEWAEVRLHPQEGARWILAASGPGQEIAAVIALEHHVRADGAGYPDLAGRRPHPFSRMVTVADSYDAITSRRPHRPARTPHEALRIILDGAGTVYDPDLARTFLHALGAYPPGSLLRLASGEMVVVTRRAEGRANSAVVVRDRSGAALEDPIPIQFERSDVAEQLLAEDAGVDPGSLLEVVEG